jgi:hypothetical protein
VLFPLSSKIPLISCFNHPFADRFSRIPLHLSPFRSLNPLFGPSPLLPCPALFLFHLTPPLLLISLLRSRPVPTSLASD